MSKEKINEKDFKDAATKIGCSVAAIKAVAEVESKQSGFDEKDQPVILFERHVFSAKTNHLFDQSNPNVSNPTPGGYGPSNKQHARLAEAVKLNREAALMSASWGKFQIMGFNFALCGFNSLQDFINAMYSSERAHLMAFVNYVIESSLGDELRDKRWADFAKRYNGPTYKKNKYDEKLAAAYLKYK